MRNVLERIPIVCIFGRNQAQTSTTFNDILSVHRLVTKVRETERYNACVNEFECTTKAAMSYANFRDRVR